MGSRYGEPILNNLIMITDKLLSFFDNALLATLTALFVFWWIKAIITAIKSRDKKSIIATCGLAAIAVAVVCLYEFGAMPLYEKLSADSAIPTGMIVGVAFLLLFWGAVIYNLVLYYRKLRKAYDLKSLLYFLLTAVVSLPLLSWATWKIISEV